MKDDEMLAIAAVLVFAFWWIFLRKSQSQNRRRVLSGNQGTGTGAIGGGASKTPSLWRNNNPLTNVQTAGASFTQAPLAPSGFTKKAVSKNVGSLSKLAGTTGSTTTNSWAGSVISPSWPTTRVTSRGTVQIATGNVQVPSYAAVPLTPRAAGGAGTWINTEDM